MVSVRPRATHRSTPRGFQGEDSALRRDDFLLINQCPPAPVHLLSTALDEDLGRKTFGPQRLARIIGTVASGLADIHRGDLDVSPEMLERLDALADIADSMPVRIGSKAAQEAAFVIARANDAQAAAIPFQESPMNVRRVWVGPDRRHRMRETDVLGRTRETVLDTTPETIKRPSRTPWSDPAKVTPDQFASWTRDQQHRFAMEHPAVMDGLKRAAEFEESTHRTLGR